ncbi:MAG: ATP-binding protein [Gemmataceae bacterium]
MLVPPIHRIVLTGGPCAGKTTALARIYAHLQEQGCMVYRVPEASTTLLNGGIVVKEAPLTHMMAFQRAIVRLQLTLEESFDSFARTAGREAVLLCDRGVMDGAAYLPRRHWLELLAREKLSEDDLRDHRYTAVIHLVTAAHGVESAYEACSNAVRYEDVEGAREVDERLRDAWRGHHHLCIIDTHPDFETKMRRVVATVSEIVGVPPPH